MMLKKKISTKKQKKFTERVHMPTKKQFKPNRSSKHAVLSQSAVTNVPDFPRGGQRSLTREEINAECKEELRDLKKQRRQQQSQNSDIGCGDEELPYLAYLEARASVLPLEVPCYDLELEDIITEEVRGRKEHINDITLTEAKNKRQAKKRADEERNQEIKASEPTSTDDFEKLIRNSPNSSFIWIKYMEFMVDKADIRGARSVAERALKTINIREEAEKFNIWVAYLNLENKHGNPPQEAVLEVLHRASQYCNPKKVNLALLGLYENTKQHRLTEEHLKRMVKKFKHSCKVWLRQFRFLLEQNQEVQSVVKRAVLCLPRHKHIKFLSQTAILEFKCGVPDRGRSIFEGMLRKNPKRTDLWSVYVDQEKNLGDADVARALFERAVSLNLPPKKMKFLFKKYHEYEEVLGDEERIEYVKMKAMEYVNNTLA